MTVRFIRLFVATFVLLNALFSGALAEALDCGKVESGSNLVHEHAAFTSHDPQPDATDADEPDRSNVFHEALGCHNAGSGCPGCLAPIYGANIAPAGHRVTYPLSDHVGRSIQLTDSFRPPITSL